MAQRSLALEVHRYYLLSFVAPVHQKGPLALYCSIDCHKGRRGLLTITAVTTKTIYDEKGNDPNH
jgi:hypothetical protein